MDTFFDFVTVACFIGLVTAFFLLTERDIWTLLHLLLPGITFAIANQVGNEGSTALAVTLIGAGIGYAVLIVRGKRGGTS